MFVHGKPSQPSLLFANKANKPSRVESPGGRLLPYLQILCMPGTITPAYFVQPLLKDERKVFYCGHEVKYFVGAVTFGQHVVSPNKC